MKEIKSVSGFKDAIREGMVLVDFYTEWCGPCKTQSRVLKVREAHLKGLHEGLEICSLDCDALSEIADEHDIRAVPQLILFKDGQAHEMESGLKNFSQIKAFLEEHSKPSRVESPEDESIPLEEELERAFKEASKREYSLRGLLRGFKFYLGDLVSGTSGERILENLQHSMDEILDKFTHEILHTLEWWSVDLATTRLSE